jgi:DHA1 family bicyclomycin/chloramphenicol resistance-like MFS transporter
MERNSICGGPRHMTLLLAALTGLTALSIDMSLPAMPQLVTTFHASAGAVQLTLSLFLLGFAMGQFICGPLSDRIGRRPVLLAGLMVFALAGLVCGLSRSLAILVAARWMQGLGASVGPIVARAIVRDCFDHRQSADVLSQMTQVMIVAPLLAPLLGGYLLVWSGWPTIFLVLAGSGVLLFLLCWRVLPETLAHLSNQVTRSDTSAQPAQSQPATSWWQGFRQVLSHRSTVRHLLTSCFAYSGMFAYISGSPFVVIDVFHVARQNFAFVFALTALALMVGASLNRKLLAQYAPTSLLRYGVACVLAGGLLMVMLAWFHLGGLAGVVGPMMLYMLGQGLVQPNAMASALAPHGRLAGAASSLMGGLQTAGGALSGYCVAAFYNGTSLSLAATVAVMAALAFVVLDHSKSEFQMTDQAEMSEAESEGDLALLESGA